MMQTQPAQWTDGELQGLQADYPDVHGAYDTNPSKYNPRPGKSSSCSRSALFWCLCDEDLGRAPLGTLKRSLDCIGTGRTGYLQVAPNNYPFYSDEEKYIPIMQSDGGQLSGK